jgi:hypothetical protein
MSWSSEKSLNEQVCCWHRLSLRFIQRIALDLLSYATIDELVIFWTNSRFYISLFDHGRPQAKSTLVSANSVGFIENLNMYFFEPILCLIFSAWRESYFELWDMNARVFVRTWEIAEELLAYESKEENAKVFSVEGGHRNPFVHSWALSAIFSLSQRSALPLRSKSPFVKSFFAFESSRHRKNNIILCCIWRLMEIRDWHQSEGVLSQTVSAMRYCARYVLEFLFELTSPDSNPFSLWMLRDKEASCLRNIRSATKAIKYRDGNN